MPSVRDALTEKARKKGVDPEEVIEGYVCFRVSRSVPVRYRGLAKDVLLRLADGWENADGEYAVELLIEMRDVGQPRGRYACCWSEFEDPEWEVVPWTVALFPVMLDRLSDAACRWVIAHALGHVSRGSSCIPSLKDTAEDAADLLALQWGFGRELDAFLREDV